MTPDTRRISPDPSLPASPRMRAADGPGDLLGLGRPQQAPDFHTKPLDRKADFRRCVGSFPTGVCVVAAEHDGLPAGMTLNSFTSVSLDPMLVLVSLAHGTRTLDTVRGAGRFAVSMLHRGQHTVAVDFASRGAVFPELHVSRTADRFLVVRHALAWLTCDVDSMVHAGDHDVVIGLVVDFDAAAGEPLVFYGGQFGGVAADTAAPAGFSAFLEEGIGW
jgi:flavin reductase (DIM6/NTAB) family NADH-FMN oxidoreductase RutF